MSKVRQVEEFLVGTKVSTQSTIGTFISSALRGDLQVVHESGTAPVSGEPFKILMKTNDARNSSGYEWSSIIDPKKIKKITLAEYSPEVQKKVTVTATVEDATTYIIEIRLFNPNGALSVENFELISGYYMTGINTADTSNDVAAGLAKSLQNTLMRRGDSEFTVTSSGAVVTIEAKEQALIPGKMDGKPLQFDVRVKSVDNASLLNTDTNKLVLAVTAEGDTGSGTGKYAVTREWFVKGFKYDTYRGTAYPADLDPPYYTKADGMYNVINILHYSDRISPTVEQQYKATTILIEKSANNDASNEETNKLLTRLKLAVDSSLVPSNLDQ